MLKFKIRKNTSNTNWNTFILDNTYLSPDRSYISGITTSTEPIASDSTVLVKKKDDDTYTNYLVANVKSAIIHGYVTYYRRIPEQRVSRTVDYFDRLLNRFSTKTISSKYVIYNDAVYYRYGFKTDVINSGYFINDRYYPVSDNSIVIDENIPIETDKVEIDGHIFTVFSSGSSSNSYYLRYNDESGPLTEINGSGYTVEIFPVSGYERVQKVVLYKNSENEISIDDIKAGAYRYYINVDGQPYKIAFNEEYDRYGVTYNDKFFPITHYNDSNPFIPVNPDVDGKTPLADVSGTTRCMPPFDNHVVRITQDENSATSVVSITTRIPDTETGTTYSYVMVGTSNVDGVEYAILSGDSRCEGNDLEYVAFVDESYETGKPLYKSDGEFVDYRETVGEIKTLDVYNSRKFSEFPVMESLETNSDGDFLIMMSSDENQFRIGDKIVAKSKGPIETTYELENDDETMYLMYNGKRYDAILHEFDTINLHGKEVRLFYDDDEFTYAHFVDDGETVHVKCEDFRVDFTNIGLSGATIHLQPGDYKYSADVDIEELPVPEYHIVMDDVFDHTYSTSPVENVFSIEEEGDYFIYVDDSISAGTALANILTIETTNRMAKRVDPTYLRVSLDGRVMPDYITQTYSGLSAYIINEYGNGASWDYGYPITQGNAIKIGVNYYKIFESKRLIYDDNGLVTDATIYSVTITEPQEFKFVIRETLGSTTALLYSYNDNLLNEQYVELSDETTPPERGYENLTPPYYPYGVAVINSNWDKYSFYFLDDIFGEENVSPEGGLIKAIERFEPTSSWDLNKIRSNLDTYQNAGYMNLQLPITTFVAPNPLKEDMRSNVLVNEYVTANINKIVDMEKIPFRMADENNNLIDRFSVYVNDYDLGLALNEYGVVPSSVKNSFLRMSFYDSTSTQTQELIGTMCMFFGGASIRNGSNNCGVDGLICEDIKADQSTTYNSVYSVYSSSTNKNTSSEGLTLYAFRYNYAVMKDMTVYMKLEYNNAKTGKIMPLCPRRRTPIKVGDLSKALYFTFTLRYDKDKGYLFIPYHYSTGSFSDRCWVIPETPKDGIHGGILLCKKPEILDESGLSLV